MAEHDFGSQLLCRCNGQYHHVTMKLRGCQNASSDDAESHVHKQLCYLLQTSFTHACCELYQTSQVPFLIACARFWALHVGSKCCLYEFTELNFLSVGSQLPPRTLNILID